jgi:RHH-type proline utilization regulon transcriptional repressor/proline dehydrogenase/delta 1-pyrroline-5-carboxylate dehydrogenase
MTDLSLLRTRIDDLTYTNETALIAQLRDQAGLSPDQRAKICGAAAQLVRDIRNTSNPGLMEVFLAEYGLSTDEGVALMCLAEALLRVPDATTIDALIEDKIAPSNWGKHMGASTSPLVNASTWALMLTGKVLAEDANPGPVGHLRAAIKRLGEPVIRTAVARAMKEMGAQFVLGETIQSAMTRGKAQEDKGYTYSYDMLGEAARTEADARRYHLAYSKAITAIAEGAHSDDIRENPGISVKLSALYARYDDLQREAAVQALVPRLRSLCGLARSAGIGLNIDAEEADRLSISLDIIQEVLSDPTLAGWEGFGVVVQAYGLRAGATLDWLYGLAKQQDRKIMIRLVKGAYWDTEIKLAQVNGLAGFPVFTDKAATDVSYISVASKLLGMTDHIYPQFATHNAHTVSAVLEMAGDKAQFEFQRLHGMGETLHELVKAQEGTRCRIYAPVGAHRDLLAYLVRRLLENGANSSFVNQIVDEEVAPEEVARDPFEIARPARGLPAGKDLFLPERPNSQGFDLRHRPTLDAIKAARAAFARHGWRAGPLIAGADIDRPHSAVLDPSAPSDEVGQVIWADPADVAQAAQAARPWGANAEQRAQILNAAADLYEARYGELFALLHREAGKTLPDAVAELREAVDFLRYYAARAEGAPAVGIFACISPWNFPLAIFTGQIAAALAVGNAVLAKPAPQTPLIAYRAVQLLHEAGVPLTALQLLPGGTDVGAALTRAPQVGGVAFTGSTETAQVIHRSIAQHLTPGTPFIAETGGLNAMIVDSTALPEQAVQAIIESAFQSAGQRCSALRCLYVQEDIAEDFLEMLKGAMDSLVIGQGWDEATDLGPVIDLQAHAGITAHIQQAAREGCVMKTMATPAQGHYIAPTLIRIDTIAQLQREIFGPVLHVATFKASDLDQIIDDINATGYGLTFGLQTRIDDRVQQICDRIHAGNIYVNRNQIGAIVGSQPFGGEGLSGTGPKAGGPLYLSRFRRDPVDQVQQDWTQPMDLSALQAQLTTQPQGPETCQDLPGPTGEANQLRSEPRAAVLCLGPGAEAAKQQAGLITQMGGSAVMAEGEMLPKHLETLSGFSNAIWWGDPARGRAYRQALAARKGPIVQLITAKPDAAHARSERHICIDTTAAGGNAALLAGQSE